MTGKDKKGIMIIIGVFVCILSLFVLSHRLKASSDDYDYETLCRLDGDYSVVKLLIDKTDPWGKKNKQRLAGLIRRIKDTLAPYERLSIFILDETGTYSPSPVFDMCNPGRGDQANNLYENPRMIQQRFDEKFAAPLDSMLDELLEPGVAPQSPILETVSGLMDSAKQERLVVVSDMMQNSEALSLYKEHSSVNDSSKINDLCELPNHYQSANIYFINRPNISASAKQDVRNFWNKCFEGVANSFVWEAL